MTTDGRATDSLDCDLCIVGAGYAALNGLNAAAKYLSKGARVVVIDKNAGWGGQWLHQYDFVRLHQPYRMFTAGDQRWTLQRDPSHLATRREVLDHLASVPAISGRELEIKPLFGHAFTGHSLREGRVEVQATELSGSKPPKRIRAKRLLKAIGVDVQPLPPYPISSTRVRSVAPSDPVLAQPEFLQSQAPVYIIGSGKTAMDVARHVIRHRSGQRRELNVIAGSGMWFFVRDTLYPPGAQRYLRGTLNSDMFLTMCELYNGHNDSEIMERFRRKGLVHAVWGHAGNCRLGLLSIAERDELRAGVDRVFHGHLLDVEGTTMTIAADGVVQTHKVPDGAWFINCTTHFRHFPHEPVLQDSGLVCTPQHALGLTGTSAYILTHAWLRGELAAVASELFRMRIDVQPKLRFVTNIGLMAMANVALINAHLPTKILAEFEGDFNKWYPSYRRLPLLARMIKHRSMLLEKAARILRLRFSDSSDADQEQLSTPAQVRGARAAAC
jgi:hypothetical protein